MRYATNNRNAPDGQKGHESGGNTGSEIEIMLNEIGSDVISVAEEGVENNSSKITDNPTTDTMSEQNSEMEMKEEAESEDESSDFFSVDSWNSEEEEEEEVNNKMIFMIAIIGGLFLFLIWKFFIHDVNEAEKQVKELKKLLTHFVNNVKEDFDEAAINQKYEDFLAKSENFKTIQNYDKILQEAAEKKEARIEMSMQFTKMQKYHTEFTENIKKGNTDISRIDKIYETFAEEMKAFKEHPKYNFIMSQVDVEVRNEKKKLNQKKIQKQTVHMQKDDVLESKKKNKTDIEKTIAIIKKEEEKNAEKNDDQTKDQKVTETTILEAKEEDDDKTQDKFSGRAVDFDKSIKEKFQQEKDTVIKASFCGPTIVGKTKNFYTKFFKKFEEENPSYKYELLTESDFQKMMENEYSDQYRIEERKENMYNVMAWFATLFGLFLFVFVIIYLIPIPGKDHGVGVTKSCIYAGYTLAGCLGYLLFILFIFGLQYCCGCKGSSGASVDPNCAICVMNM